MDDPLANLPMADRLALLQALMADDSDADDLGVEGEGGAPPAEYDGSGSNIASHQGAVAMMDMARRFMPRVPLIDAAVRGDVPTLQALLQQPGADINVRDTLTETPLFAAVCHDHLEAAALLLQKGADPNLLCSNSWAALHAVARSNNEDMAALLLQWNADSEVKDSVGWAPLHVASLYGNNGVATILLEKEADANALAYDERIPLHTAVDYGRHDVIRTLVRHRARLETKDDQGQTPLHIAAMKRPFPPPVSLLLELGADPRSADKVGNTALHHAIAAGHDPALAMVPLLRKGADPNAEASGGWTPLLRAIQETKRPGPHGEAILETLLKEKGIEINHVSSLPGGDTTPLIFGIEARSRRAVELLLAHGADPKLATEREGHVASPIFQAVVRHTPEEPELVRLLLNAQVDPKEKMEGDVTMAHIAALQGNTETLRLLLQNGAEVNAIDLMNGSPLHIAAREGHTECIKVLIALGADVNIKAKDRSTPLHDAAKRADKGNIRLLLEAGTDMTTIVGDGGMQSPLNIMQEKLRNAEDAESRRSHLEIVAMMMEKLAERDPRSRQAVQDQQEGWLLNELAQVSLRDDDDDTERPRGPGIGELAGRYQPRFGSAAGGAGGSTIR